MGSPSFSHARPVQAVLVAMSFGCSGAEAPPATPSAPANVVTEIEPARVANHPPRFISLAPDRAREGEPYTYGFAALDPDGDEVRYVLVRAPEGATLKGQLLEWVPRHRQAGRPQRFTLRAVDEHGAARDQTWSVIPRAEAEPRRHRTTPSHRF